jgi:hypothetical protein
MNVALTLEDELVTRIAEVVLERMNEPRWFDVDGLSGHLDVPVRQIRLWREMGLPARRAGKRLMFNLDEVHEWLDALPRR